MNQILRHNGKCTASYQLEPEIVQEIKRLSFRLSEQAGERITQGQIVARAIRLLSEQQKNK